MLSYRVCLNESCGFAGEEKNKTKREESRDTSNETKRDIQ